LADNPTGTIEEDVAVGGRRKRLLRIMALAVLILAVLWAVWYMLTQAGRVHTDNAYVGADTAQVTPLVGGAVTEIHVGNTQTVKRGDVLVVLDDADAGIDVATAEAALVQAQQRYNQSSAMAGAARARVGARGADIAQANAKLAEARAAYERSRLDQSRREALIASGAVSGEELSSARTSFSAAKAALDLAQAGVVMARETRASAGGDLLASEAVVRGTTLASAPDVAAARARLEKARLDYDRTIIRAPIDGVVASRQVQLGQRVAPGTAIMAIVPVNAAFVDANYKESQLRQVRVGQPVALTSDYYGNGVVFHGRVTGFAGGTGAAFSLIPAQNATGNWVKIVQRLPVRVALDPAELRDHPLRVGLSMDAIIDTRTK
jgi:membrane fusion protein, multidrug efflux system